MGKVKNEAQKAILKECDKKRQKRESTIHTVNLTLTFFSKKMASLMKKYVDTHQLNKDFLQYVLKDNRACKKKRKESK